jgi:hypothetical protein
MKFRYFPVLLCLLFFSSSCHKSFDHSSKGMQQLNKVLEDKFGAEAWYSSITLVHDGAGDDVVTVERALDPDKAQQEQWTWFHGFWEKKADINLQFSGILPRDLLFQLQTGASLLQLGKLIENALKELAADPANGHGKLVLAEIKMNDPSPARPHNLSYMIQLKTGKGMSYNYTYDDKGQKTVPPSQP